MLVADGPPDVGGTSRVLGSLIWYFVLHQVTILYYTKSVHLRLAMPYFLGGTVKGHRWWIC